MKRRVLRLAAFVALSSILTWWIGQSITGGTPGDRYQLTATFSDVAGMRDGDAVKLAGLTVGTVDAIEVVDGRALVTFSVDREVTLPVDTTAKVRWRNLVGQRFLGLEPGEASELLADGDALERSQDVVDLGQLVNQLVPLAASVSPERINEILTALLTALDGNEAGLDALLSDVTTVLEVVAERDGTLRQLLTDYDTIAAALASRDVQIGQMVDNLVAISETFAANDELLDVALVELAELSSGLDTLLDRSADDLGATLEHLASLVGLATDHLDELESGLQGLPHTFEELHDAVSAGEWLRVSVLCATPMPGPCPIPTSVSGEDDPLVFDEGGILKDLLNSLGLGGLGLGASR